MIFEIFVGVWVVPAAIIFGTLLCLSFLGLILGLIKIIFYLGFMLFVLLANRFINFNLLTKILIVLSSLLVASLLEFVIPILSFLFMIIFLISLVLLFAKEQIEMINEDKYWHVKETCDYES